MARVWCISVALMIGSHTYAQQCQTEDIHTQFQQTYSSLPIDERESVIDIYRTKGNTQTRSTTLLPVVVHVISRLPEHDITDEQIWSQIEVLNEDFRGNNINFDITPRPFQDNRADMELEFCLAENPDDPTMPKGITRRTTTVENFGLTTSFYKEAEGGTDPWNPQKYINIYICELSPDFLGFANMPNSGLEFDGIVIPSQYFGRIGTATTSAPNDLGRTLTHEMGHYLGLFHLWGTDNSSCPNGDFVDDTPSQETWSEGCPSFPLRDLCTPGPNGIMFNNFMDYTDDECSSFFTEDQKERVWAQIQAFRPGLLDGDICEGTSVVNEPGPSDFSSFHVIDRMLHVNLRRSMTNLSIVVHSMEGHIHANLKYPGTQKITVDLQHLNSGSYAFSLMVGSHIINSSIFVVH